MAQYDDVRTSSIAIVGVIGALAVFLLILLMMVLYQGVQQRQNTIKDIDRPFAQRDDLLAKQRAQLNNYRWLKEVEGKGEKKEVYVIPIDRAMELVVVELGSRAGRQGETPPRKSAPGAEKSAGGRERGKSDAKR